MNRVGYVRRSNQAMGKHRAKQSGVLAGSLNVSSIED